MIKDDISDVIASVLGCTEGSSGIQPAEIGSRLNKLPPEIQSVVESYFNRMMQFPLPENSSDLAKLGDAAEVWASVEMPELKPIAREGLANYYTYQWR